MLVSFHRIFNHPGIRRLCSQVGPPIAPAVLDFLKHGVASTSRQFTIGDVANFAELTGDRNAIHVDDKAANRVGFDRCIVHGALLNGLVSGLIAENLPNCVVVNQDLHFPHALLVDEPVTVSLELINQRKRFVSVKYTCRDSLQRVVMHGEARVALAVVKQKVAPASPS